MHSFKFELEIDLPNLCLFLGLRIRPQLMDGLSAGLIHPKGKR